jgi:hypothetical protein
MAGDWIKIEENMPEKPEVWVMAEALSIEPDAIAGKLIRVWAWASRNCNGDGVTHVTVRSLLDRCAGVSGFANAMEKAGWLVIENGKLMFPNFDRHNGTTAKSRALVAKRVKRCRNAVSVTKALPEKRREESINKKTTQPVKIETAIAYGSQIGMPEDAVKHWHDTRSRDGWMITGNNGISRPIMSWQHDMATAKNWKQAAPAKQSNSKPRFPGIQEDLSSQIPDL